MELNSITSSLLPISRQLQLQPFPVKLAFQQISKQPLSSSLSLKPINSLKLNPQYHFLKLKTNSSGLSSSSREGRVSSSSGNDDEPFETSSYLEEQDIATFLNPPKELIPFDPASYNPAAYLWSKIEDVPAERRHRLLYVLEARLISRMWQVVGTRYQNEKLAKKKASDLLSLKRGPMEVEHWSCQTSKGPLPIAWNWINNFKKAIFHSKDGGTYGRIVLGGPSPAAMTNLYGPLYFTVRQVSEVMSTEQPCDLAYEFGDGLLDLNDLPPGFPNPVEHRWPFNDHMVIYVRHAGPGVLVGQAWQEGKDLEQVPKKFCGEILMVKDYNASGQS